MTKVLKAVAATGAILAISLGAGAAISTADNPHGDKTDPNASCQHTPTGQGKPSGECNDQGLPQSEGCLHGQAPEQNPHCTPPPPPCEACTTSTTPTTTDTVPTTTDTVPTTTPTDTTPSTTSTDTTPVAPATGVPPTSGTPGQATGVTPTGQATGHATGNTPTAVQAQRAAGGLPFTGQDIAAMVLVAIAMIGAGGLGFHYLGYKVPLLSNWLGG